MSLPKKRRISPEQDAHALLGELVDNYDPSYGLGRMTCSIYDTAWVACVAKTVAGCTLYLFPLCFSIILRSQSPSGAWSNTVSESEEPDVDQVLSTLAAVFALSQLAKEPHQLRKLARFASLDSCITKGVDFLSKNLPRWQIRRSREVGFEILIPSLLRLLEEEGIQFKFPAKKVLYDLRDQKLAKLPPKLLYQDTPLALLHSLEAFYRDPAFSFDAVRHHKVRGSMMASPSSTAAYLMSVSLWDEEAEAYLRLVHETGSGNGMGGIPSAFPSTYFELTWIISNFLAVGMTEDAIGPLQLEKCYKLLEEARHRNGGLVGFADGIEPDADDSAKASVVFSMMNKPGISKLLVERFAASGHLKTYAAERDPSFTANCNALLAILLDSDHSIPIAKVREIATFLSKTWWNSDKSPEDKWNISPFYSSLSMAHAFGVLLEKWDRGLLPELPEDFLAEMVVLPLFQCLVRTLKSQNHDGSWGHVGVREETSYAILTLNYLLPLPTAQFFREDVVSAIERGRSFLESVSAVQEPECLWVEKTLYGSKNLSQSYIIAALHVSCSRKSLGDRVKNLWPLDDVEMSQFGKFMQRLPLFTSSPMWLILASWVEGKMFLPRLKRLRQNVFKREGMTKDKYFSWIPFTWTASNNLEGEFLSSQFIFDMMTLSFLNFQADEFMEVVIDAQLGSHLETIKEEIQKMFLTTLSSEDSSPALDFPTKAEDHKISNGAVTTPPVEMDSENLKSRNGSCDANGYHTPEISNATSTLANFVKYIMTHPGISESSDRDRRQLAEELKAFLLAHVTQIEDNRELAKLKNPSEHLSSQSIVFQNPRQTFQQWVRTTSAQHTSCPYSFVFASCLRAGHRHDFFPSLSEKYVAQDVCHRLATMCRMYNDHGSMQRDRREWNLNSVNFPEFHEPSSESVDGAATNVNGTDRATCAGSDEALKARLHGLAEYERRSLNLAVAELEKITSKENMGMLKVFLTVTDMFGQIYVVKDIASQRLT